MKEDLTHFEHQVRRAFEGDSWHGPAVLESMDELRGLNRKVRQAIRAFAEDRLHQVLAAGHASAFMHFAGLPRTTLITRVRYRSCGKRSRHRPVAGLPRGLAVALAIGAALPAAAPAQEDAGDLLRAALSRRTVAAALDRVGRAEERAVTTLTELASIVSPSGHEHERAAAAARRMRAIGLAGVTVDSTPNAWGTIPGTSGRALVFVTMLDDLPDIEALQRSGRHRPAARGAASWAPPPRSSPPWPRCWSAPRPRNGSFRR